MGKNMFKYLDMQKHPPEVSHKKGALKNFAKFTENTCARGSFLIKLQASDFIKNETLVQVFSCEFCESFKNTFFTEHIRATASIYFILQCLNLN